MKSINEYRLELLKQTEPYLYYIEQKKQTERGNSIMVEGPLPCVINIPGIEASSYKCVIWNKNFTEDSTEITYVMLKTPNIRLYDEGIERMIETGIGAGDEKLIPDLIYSDHDYVSDEGRHHTPYFKPDYSPHLLWDNNYMGDLVVVRRETLNEALSEEGYDKYDNPKLALWALIRHISRICNKITHVSEILWFQSSNDSSEKIYSDFLKTYDGTADGFGLASDKAGYSLSIIIPSKDHSDILINCIESIKNKSGFNLKDRGEIIIIDNGSYLTERTKVEDYVSKNDDINIRYIYEPCEFNFAAMCNRAAKEARGDLLLFLNDDIEAVTFGFIEKMAGYALLDNVGAVGAKLLYPNGNLIQHVGVTSLKCGPTHKLATNPDDKTYYFGVNKSVRDCLALTGACLMITKEKYFQVNGFYDKMKVSYNDVDLCVNLFEKGLFNVVLNDVILIHHESLSRGSDVISDDKYLRLSEERDLFYERHPWLLSEGDPFYNRNLIQDTLDYRPNVMPDYEIRDKICQVEILSCKRWHKAFRDRLKFCIEKTSFAPFFERERGHFIEIEGWSLFLNRDERFYRRYLLFIPDAGDVVRVSLMPKYRPDVGAVFADEKNTDLSGFVLRIPETTLKSGSKYRVAVMYEHRIFHHRVVACGDYYEPGKEYGEK